ncbi:PepSY domain-containing protein [Nitrobacter hamburgensis]|uniref:PepSY domain-containing protein n=1 Tax=Nitrobacter hamburgensis TaxID=912 RepID=UPI0000556344|nr:PepSY domain-containing protein [Nitrobacter hamburgensis]
MTQKTLRKWSCVHKWSSIVCTLFMLMLCITSLPLIFHDEIYALLHDQAEGPSSLKARRPRTSTASWPARWLPCPTRCRIS